MCGVMKLWISDVFEEVEDCSGVSVPMQYYIFFHLFFNAMLQNIELCLGSFNAVNVSGFNSLSNLFAHNLFLWHSKSGKFKVI